MFYSICSVTRCEYRFAIRIVSKWNIYSYIRNIKLYFNFHSKPVKQYKVYFIKRFFLHFYLKRKRIIFLNIKYSYTFKSNKYYTEISILKQNECLTNSSNKLLNGINILESRFGGTPVT